MLDPLIAVPILKGHFKEMGMKFSCPACGNDEWDVFEIATNPISFQEKKLWDVKIICTSCSRIVSYGLSIRA